MPFQSSGGKDRALDDAHLVLFGCVGNITEAVAAHVPDLRFLWIHLVDALILHNEIEERDIDLHQTELQARDHRAAHRYLYREAQALRDNPDDLERMERFFYQLKCHSAGPLEQNLFERMHSDQPD
jgi:hypothetical protein